MATKKINIPPEGIELYIARRSYDLEKLKAALETGDTPEFFRIGHGLKGNAVSFGFPELESLGKQLERVAVSCDWGMARILIRYLESWCHKKSELKSFEEKKKLKITTGNFS
ncbi:MAG: Hpt domain-containing protein [Bdellovibrio sp.]